jgi:hypothetical protein
VFVGRYLAGGSRVPNVDVKDDSEGPGMGDLAPSKGAPGRGRTRSD